MAPLRDITGVRYERLVAIRVAHTDHRGQVSWLCKCDCGKYTRVRQLLSGRIKSCGCYFKEMQHTWVTKHGRYKTPEYTTWSALRQRCNNPRNKRYHRYGGRGIKVCARWQSSFESFYKDMGPKPSLKHTIDRIDNDKGYSKQNCKWSTHSEQNFNNSRNKPVFINGSKYTVKDLALAHNLHEVTIRSRIRLGFSGEDLIKPPRTLRR